MPEMPEVEIIRRGLADQIAGQTIHDVEVSLGRLIKWPTIEQFQAQLHERRILAIERRGKYLLLKLAGQLILVVHLRMTGRLLYAGDETVTDKYTRIVFYLDNGARLLYADTRTLGTLYLMPDDELWRISGLYNLGPEPLSAEFSLAYFLELLHKKTGCIKAVLLNQKLIGGLGNIYVDESLALSGIHPERKANSLDADETGRLYDAVNAVIRQGIEDGGTTFRDYRNGYGQRGRHQANLYVYGRKGKPCRTCGTLIAYKTVAGRGTHFCPHCQPEDK